MKITKIEIIGLKIPFKTKFTHALKSRNHSNNILIKISSENTYGIGESLPREYVTGENINSVLTYINKIIPKLLKLEFKTSKEGLNFLIKRSENLKKYENSAFGAISDALLNLICQEFNLTIKDVLNHLNIDSDFEKETTNYSAILSDSNKSLMLLKSLLIKTRNFKQVKIKTTPYTINKLNSISKILSKQELRIDGNCSFNLTEIKQNLKILKTSKIKYFEQPYSTSYNNLKKQKISILLEKNNIKIIHDEDFCSKEDINKFNYYGHIASIRINKNAGIINSLLLYKILQEKKILCMLNCLVGETVLTRYNLILSKYLNTIGNEGNYDEFLFGENKIINNPNFKRNGDLTKIKYDLNQKINLKYIKKNLIFYSKIVSNNKKYKKNKKNS